MPIVVLQVDAETGGLTAGVGKAKVELGALAEAIGKIAGETTAMESSVTRTMTAMVASIGTVTTALEQMVIKIGAVEVAVDDLTGTVVSAATTQIASITAVGAAYDLVTAAIKRQAAAARDSGTATGGTAAVAAATAGNARFPAAGTPQATYQNEMADLAHQRLLLQNDQAITRGNTAMDNATRLRATTYGMLGTAPTADEEVAAANAAAEDAARARAAQTAGRDVGGLERSGRAVARAGATDLLGEGGAGALFGSGLIGPAGITGLIAGFAGYKALEAANNFQSAEVQTGAQVKNPLLAQQTGDAILAFSKAGGAPYDPTVVMKSIEPLLAHGYSQATINAGIKPLEELSAQNKAPDISTAVNGVNTYLALMGSGAKSTAAQMVDAVNYMSKVETLTTIPPGDLSRVLPNLLVSAQQAGVSADQAAGALIKIGTANPNAPQDVTTIGRLMQEMLTKNTPGAQAEAASLGLVMGPGALAAYGGSFEAMIQAYANATAGPNQGAEIAKLFPTSGVRGGATAFRELISGGGTTQALGYEDQVANRAGTADSVYGDYSKGVNQRATQELHQFTTDLIGVGNTLEENVIPALLDFTGGLLNGVNRLGDILGYSGVGLGRGINGVEKAASATGSFIDNFIPGGKGTILMDALPGGLLIAAIHGIAGNHIDIPKPNYTATLPADVSGPLGPGQTRLYAPGVQPGAPHLTLGYNVAGPLGPDESRATHGAPSATDDNHIYAVNMGTITRDLTLVHNSWQNLIGVTDGVAPGLNYLASAAKAVGDDMRTLGMRPGDTAAGFKTNLPVGVDRSILTGMESTGASSASLYTQLAKVKADLANSFYSPEQQQSIYTKASQNTFAAAVGPGDQMKIQAAQMNLDAATQMGEPPKTIKRDQDAYIAALNQFARDTMHGTALNRQLGANAQQGELYGFVDNSDAINRSVKDMQNAIAIDKVNGNDAAAKSDTQKLLAYQAKNAGILKLDPSDLALMRAQANADMIATSVVNTHPFFQRNPGLGAFAAGSGNTAVRAGGAVDPSTAEIRLLRQELTAAQAMNTQLLQQIARNTGVRAQAAGMPGATSGRYTTGR